MKLRSGLALAAALLLVAGCETSSLPTSPMDAGLEGEAALAKKGKKGTPTSIGSCDFFESGSTLTLAADCQTTETVEIPDGKTLDGAGYTITAVDPAGDHFRGAVVANGGTVAHVVNLTVAANGLASVCQSPGPVDNRLRGIMLNGASGSITKSTVVGINKGASGCQEGNAIEVRNAPFDGTHPNTQTVKIAHNTVDAYQKTGIVANGDVEVTLEHNTVGASATQLNLAANSIQLGFGALGSATHNHVAGNQWMGTSDFAASAILVFLTGPVNVSKNNIGGNSDVGLFIIADDGTFDNNKVFDEGADHPNSGYDIGLGSYGDNVVTNNKVRGFDTAYEGVSGGGNKAIPGKNSSDVLPASIFAN